MSVKYGDIDAESSTGDFFSVYGGSEMQLYIKDDVVVSLTVSPCLQITTSKYSALLFHAATMGLIFASTYTESGKNTIIIYLMNVSENSIPSPNRE